MSSTEPNECFKKLKISKILSIVIMTALIASFGMEIIDKVEVADNYISFQICNRILSFLTEPPILIFNWRYFIRFIQLKKELRPLSPLEYRITLAIIGVLILNSINSVAFNTMQICIRFSSNEADYARLLEVWTLFSEFFYDLLTLINGIAILQLFRHISNSVSKSGLSSIKHVLSE